MEYPTFDLYFLCIHARLWKGSCAYEGNTSDSWEVFHCTPLESMHCITSPGMHAKNGYLFIDRDDIATHEES